MVESMEVSRPSSAEMPITLSQNSDCTLPEIAEIDDNLNTLFTAYDRLKKGTEFPLLYLSVLKNKWCPFEFWRQAVRDNSLLETMSRLAQRYLSLQRASTYSEGIFVYAESNTSKQRAACGIKRLNQRQFVRHNMSSVEVEFKKALPNFNNPMFLRELRSRLKDTPENFNDHKEYLEEVDADAQVMVNLVDHGDEETDDEDELYEEEEEQEEEGLVVNKKLQCGYCNQLRMIEFKMTKKMPEVVCDSCHEKINNKVGTKFMGCDFCACFDLCLKCYKD